MILFVSHVIKEMYLHVWLNGAHCWNIGAVTLTCERDIDSFQSFPIFGQLHASAPSSYYTNQAHDLNFNEGLYMARTQKCTVQDP